MILIRNRPPGCPLRLILCLGIALLRSSLPAAETVWFGGTQRALPLNLAAPKEDGLYSNFVFTDDGDATWDFNLGTDANVWRRSSDSSFQTITGRFGVASRFQFNSGSFDLWAADFRGGAAWGLERGRMAYEAFFYHESSHLGDDTAQNQERTRIDYSVNGLRVLLSRRWTESLRTYGGISGQPWADPEPVRSFGFHAGAEATSLPPWQRGFVALDSEWWEWRRWDPDLTARVGLFVGTRPSDTSRFVASCYLELHYGRVMLGQFYNETEKYVAGGLGLSW